MDLARNIRCFFLIICWGRPVATGFLLTSGEWARHAWPPRHMSADNRHFHFASTFCVIVGRAVLVVCEGNLDKSDDERNRKRWRRSKCLRTGEQKKKYFLLASVPVIISFLFLFFYPAPQVWKTIFGCFAVATTISLAAPGSRYRNSPVLVPLDDNKTLKLLPAFLGPVSSSIPAAPNDRDWH